ncbi:poly(U)-specific endoribonuclease-B-like [Hibiscus syriacus]|uniref:Poly(U)-specific endoribonuclease-B-like n=1 Tax=Hibiscus syriacus TaxID=106335 RepID=A0A6A2X493_HIBSY|nr:FCS-Like Zinc finger 2-like [Hibiscus syriacus]KAE8661855.1 poly(U)-specific endoribonuclease-B-like [Hibiscus syriacus]
MESYAPPRRPCFIEEDDGLASLPDMEAGYSGSNYQRVNKYGSFSRPLLKNLPSFSSGSVPSPRSARFYDSRFDDVQQPHFLDACFLCNKPLGGNRDIFMYRGDTPFCSEDCRQEQIDMDEAKEKNKNLSSSMKAMRMKDQRKSTSANDDQGFPLRTGTVAAA